MRRRLLVALVVAAAVSGCSSVSEDAERAAEKNERTCERARAQPTPAPEWCESAWDNPNGS